MAAMTSFHAAKYCAASSGGSRKKYWRGAWPLIIWEATMAKRNYYRTN